MMGPMLLLGAVLLAPVPQAGPAVPEDVVVVGQRLRRLKLVTKTDRRTGVHRCVVKRTSGEAAFDAGLCDAALACAVATIGSATAEQRKACTAARIDAFLHAWAARHASAATDSR